MEDHLPRRALVGKDAQHVAVRLTVVDDQRLARLLGEADVRAEPLLLHAALRPVAVIVEARLADRAHLRQTGQARDLLERAIFGAAGLVRVDRDRGSDGGMFRRAPRPPSATTQDCNPPSRHG